MKHPNQMHDESLTEVEVFGLQAKFNLADGHSYIDSHLIFPDVLSQLNPIWQFAASTPVPQVEKYFRDTFADFYSLQGLRLQTHFSICPTASNSIDIVGAWAKATGAVVGLMEPTFDNLALLLKRRGVDLHAVSEARFHDLAALEREIEMKELTALFLINPNNPTGGVVTRQWLKDIVDMCVHKKVTLILDASFRFCHRWHIDEYAILQQARASYIILEDTGKIWPTLDTKASLLSYSEDFAPLIRKIYEEIYLCSSNLSLALIAAFIEGTAQRGGKAFFQEILASRQADVQTALRELPIRIENDFRDALMSVAWLNIGETGLTDLELVSYLAEHELAVLPGRYFYWNSHSKNGHQNVRLAVLKPQERFSSSLKVLRIALEKLKQPRYGWTSASC